MKSSWQWGYAACLWAVVFAGSHFYWALGGSAGLSVSAGEQLATERPLWFVLAGLWGVGAVCLVSALLGWLLARSRPHGAAARRILEYLGWGAGFILLARAIAVELLLLTNVTDLDGVSADERFWTHVLWNPWFLVGGLAFGLAARQARRRNRSSSLQTGPRLSTVRSR